MPLPVISHFAFRIQHLSDASPLPERGKHQQHDRVDLQPADQHAQGKNGLAENGQIRKVAHRADPAQARPNVIDCSDDGSHGGHDILSLQRHRQHRGHEYEDVEIKEGHHAGYNFLVHQPPVQL